MACFIKLSGQLCNHMFQIAAAYAHCRKHGGLALRLYGDITPEIYWKTYLHQCADWQGGACGGPVWREPCFSYMAIPSAARNLVGHFQSSKYFSDVSGEIRALFTLPEPLRAVSAHKHAALLTPQLLDRAVVLHIRRGDYMNRWHIKKHGILGAPYYQHALTAARKALGEDVPVLVFSDDMDWCRAQPWLAGAIFIEEPNGPISLWLMSQFRNYIISNSTFSWWAVFLGAPTKGYVWAPDRWFGETGPFDWEDIYEPSWVRLPIV